MPCPGAITGLRQGEEDALDVREAFRSQPRELIAQLESPPRPRSPPTKPVFRLARERLRTLEAAMEDLGRNAAAHGFATAALLTVLHDKGWVAKPLVTGPEARDWLTE